MKENVSALSKLHEQDMALLREQHEQEMALLREVASDTKDVKKMTAQLQAMMASESNKSNSVLSGVLEARHRCVRKAPTHSADARPCMLGCRRKPCWPRCSRRWTRLPLRRRLRSARRCWRPFSSARRSWRCVSCVALLARTTRCR